MPWLMLLLVAAAGGKSGVQAEEPKPDGSKVENPFRGVMQDRSSHSTDEALFVEKCAMCHRQMGMGTVILARRKDGRPAMLEERGDLSADFIASAVRHGLGNMPRIGRGELSDKKLAEISSYLARRSTK
jgi:mono/diheme cytochrome c family protein